MMITENPSLPDIAAIIMASGQSRRFGSEKLMAVLAGKPVISYIADRLSDMFLYTVLVTRSSSVQEYALSKGFNVILHDLPGRNDTIGLGIAALPDHIKGCLFFQGDQPFIRKETISGLIETALKNPGFIIRSSFQGIPSSPVYFPRWTFEELSSLPQGRGGNYLFPLYPEKILDFSIEDPEEIKDIDSAEDLLQAEKIISHFII